jgi:hypothetical protein
MMTVSGHKPKPVMIEAVADQNHQPTQDKEAIK